MAAWPGVVLAGESAGWLCWHASTITDFYGIRGIGDGLGPHHERDKLVAAIADRPHAGAYRVTRAADGGVCEEPLDVVWPKRGKDA